MNRICLLNSADLAQARAIEQRCHAFFWSEAVFASSQGESYLNYRIDVAGVMAGFIISRLVADEATLFNIAVDPGYQRRGLGRQLLIHLIGELEARNITTVWLEVRISNTAARALYRQQGFNEVTTRKDYYPAENGRETAMIMALPLGF